jgi:hypothetical protein
VVVYSHTVVYPRAVVVEAFNTAVTDGTVPGPGSSNAHAVGTEVGRLISFQQFQEIYLGLLQVAWVSTRTQHVGDHSDNRASYIQTKITFLQT